MTAWYIISAFLLALGAWALLPSRTLRELRRLAKEYNRPDLLKTWARYKTTKRFVSPQSIVINMTSSESFETDDLPVLNTFFRKLGQPPAEFFEPVVFARLPDAREVIVENLREGHLTHVFQVVRPGVLWRREFLNKPVVTGCSADFVALVRAAEVSAIAKKLLDALELDAPRSLRLCPSAIEEIFDLKGLRGEATELFAALEKFHPDQDFFVESVAKGDRYVQRTMRINGTTQPGQRCIVSEMTHGGLGRRSDRDWRIKAFVKIRNLDVNE